MRDQLGLRYALLDGTGDLIADAMNGTNGDPQQVQPEIKLGEYHCMTELRQGNVYISQCTVDEMPGFVAQAGYQQHEIAQRLAIFVMRGRTHA